MAETNSVAAETTEAVAAGKKLSLADVRARLDGKTGRRFWKNLDELAETSEFHELMQQEFPRQAGAGEWVDPVSRRGFMKVMGASFALAGLAGCTKQPDEPIFPYVKQPEDLVLGKPMFFATAYPFPTGALPVLVKSEAFRPIKVNGNPEHPASNGASDVFTQATLLDLYDPDRSQHVTYRGQVSSFSAFQEAFLEGVAKLPGGQGLYFLSETVTSPTLASQWKDVQAKYPQAKLVQWDPVNQDSSRAASKAAFGSYTDAQYKLAEADIILALDSDFLGGVNQPGYLTLAEGYGERHDYEEGKKMNRLYAVESMPTSTGMRAEHRLALRPSQIEGFADALVYGIAPSWLNEEQKKFFNVMLADLKKNPGRAVVIPGEQSAPSVHAAAYALNTLLGAVGKTVIYTETVNPLPTEQLPELKSLIADMKAGKVQWLVMLGTNPIYNTPVDLGFADAFAKVPNAVALSNYVDETASITPWHINKAHYLESWSDARAYDGTISIIQPMIAPLYNGKSSHEVLQTLLSDPKASAYDAVVAYAKNYIKGDFATNWRKSLHDGWVADTAFAAKAGVPARVTAFPAAKPSTSGIEIAFRPDPSLYDGRFANNGWLQEVPKPITNLSWDNAALMSINTMAQLKAEETNLIELELNGRKVKAPVLMAPGHPDGVITIHLGFGRNPLVGRVVASSKGFDAYAIRTSDALSVATGGSAKVIDGSFYDICVTKVHNTEHRGKFAQHDLEKPQYDTEGTYSLAGHEAMERSIIRYATVEEAEKNPKFAEDGASGTLVNKVGYGVQRENPEHGDPGWDAKKHVNLSMFPDAWDYKKTDPSSLKLQNAWGMSIDMNSCFGCNACIISCYAENNIPVVGREQVKVGRHMAWLRMDTYFEGDLNAPKAHFQPMACQHCENAGCEQVCPVGATVHSPEGLNLMVYNRCVGTRYCSNNCPYKVRRFNFLLYSDYDTESLKFMRNPDVSVRSRGVMEKCTYCVQRIEAAKIQADKENREIRDGDIVTACQEACPTGSISFGNQNDPNSKVAKRKAAEREYSVLGDLNYRPRTTYTAGVINPNPELA